MAEILSEQARTGERKRKPNAANPITKRRRQLREKIERESRDTGRDIAEVSLEYVEQNRGDLQRYVTSKGEVPLSNPVELATQAFIMRMEDIQSIAKTMGVSLTEAEIFLDEAEARAFDSNTSEADNFLGAIMGAVGGVANKGINKILEKKQAKGKKAGFWATLADITGGRTSEQKDSQAAEQAPAEKKDVLGELKIFADDVISKVKEQEKKKEINKMLPYIIGGVILIILVTVLIARKK